MSLYQFDRYIAKCPIAKLVIRIAPYVGHCCFISYARERYTIFIPDPFGSVRSLGKQANLITVEGSI